MKMAGVLKSYPINSDLYKVNLKVDKNSLCYELRIPFGNIPLLNWPDKYYHCAEDKC